jgi:hypothetical protein
MSALLKLHIIAMFVSERNVNAQISIPVRGPVNSNLGLFRLARTWRGGMILSTVPAMVALGCSGVRVLSRFNSAILADLWSGLITDGP